MRESKLKKLVKLVEESNIDELELSRWGAKVRIIRRRASQERVASVAPGEDHRSPQVVETTGPEEPRPQEEPPKNHYEIKSPIVGTFYRAPAPDVDPYVQEGQFVKKGDVVCIVEAMKLMNEIESEVSGRVVKALVDNAHPVEYDQPLFLMELAT